MMLYKHALPLCSLVMWTYKFMHSQKPFSTTKEKKCVPCHSYTVRPRNQPWIGYHCQVDADEKYRAQKCYMRRPINKQLCRQNSQVQVGSAAMASNLKSKLSGQSVGFAPGGSLPPLQKPNSTVATQSKDKAELLAAFLSSKITVPDPKRLSPNVLGLIKESLDTTEEGPCESQKLTRRNPCPDNISPHVLKRCAPHFDSTSCQYFFRYLESGHPSGM